MTLNIFGIQPKDLPKVFQLCERVKSLTIHRCALSPRYGLPPSNWEIQHSSHNSISEYQLEKLSVSTSCDIGLSGFFSRSSKLQALMFFPPIKNERPSNYERARMQELTECLESDRLPNLRHVELSMTCHERHKDEDLEAAANLKKNQELSRLLQSMNKLRCLKRFQSPDQFVFSITDFNHHFSTLTEMNVLSGTTDFWQQILSSCPNLVRAKQVRISPTDIDTGKQWFSAKLETLDLLLSQTKNYKASRQHVDCRLFERIAELVKVKDLTVQAEWQTTKPLSDQQWRALSNIKTLQSLELGWAYLRRLDETTVAGIKTLRGLKQFRGSWTPDKSEDLFAKDINDLGVPIVAGCPRYRFTWSRPKS